MNGITVSDIAAIIALILSGIAIWTTTKFNNRQLSLIESQEKLNKRLLAQGKTEDEEARKADVGAKYVKVGSHNYRLRVFNKGKASAQNVQIEFIGGDSPVIESELIDKFPMEVLEQHGAVDLIASLDMQTPSKQAVVLRWKDEHSNNNEKTVYLTL